MHTEAAMTLGVVTTDDTVKAAKLGALVDRLFAPHNDNSCPIVLVILNNLCRSITWKDSICCAKFSQLIYPLVIEIHSRGLLCADIIIFIFQQSICALNLFASKNFAEIKLVLLNLGVSLYEDFISKDDQLLNKFISLLDKSSTKSIEAFRSKMASKTSLKLKRGILETLLQTYIAVPTNQIFSQEIIIKDLPPLLKPHWKNKDSCNIANNLDEPLCLEDLFKCE